MDTLITYDEAAGFLQGPPTVAPRPDFTKLRALRKHMVEALSQLECPQSAVHGWTGLVMDPAMYALLEPIPFAIPVNPGAVPAIIRTSTTATIKMITLVFDRNKKYYNSFLNIHKACYKMLKDAVPVEFQVSNIPNLQGWNSTMAIIDILDQLHNNFGRPDPMTLIKNDTLFRSAFRPTDAPERLFWRIEQCQEIQVIAGNPYSDMQLMTNAVQILMASCIFSSREFEDWETTAVKTYVIFKAFVHAAYARRLTALQMRTSGQQGYAQAHNMYNVFETSDTDDDSSIVPSMTEMSTGSTFASRGTSAPSEVAAAINQLAANQTAIWKQMAALQQPNATSPACVAVPTRATQIDMTNIPSQFAAPVTANTFHQPFQTATHFGRTVPPSPGTNNPLPNPGGNQAGGRFTGRGRGRDSFRGRGRNVAAQRAVFVPGGHQVPPGLSIGTARAIVNPPHSNITKKFNNWNACYSCGFDVQDEHTSQTCPLHWRRATHDEGYTRQNAQAYLNQGYDCSTKNMHKTMLPAPRIA